MPLKNYTSKQPVSRSIENIRRKLVQHGALKILETYDDDRVIKAICFSMMIGGVEMFFKVPAKVDACEAVLMREVTSRTRPDTIKKIPAQAARTAWKIVQDWVEAQMAMIELSQTEFLEVFMAYVFDPSTEQTFFERLKVKGFKALLPAPKEKK